MVEEASARPYHTTNIYFDGLKNHAEFPYIRLCNKNSVNYTRAKELNLTDGAIVSLLFMYNSDKDNVMSEMVKNAEASKVRHYFLKFS